VLGNLDLQPQLVAVKGNYDQVTGSVGGGEHLRLGLREHQPLRPYYSEGSKTLGYEVDRAIGANCRHIRGSPEPSGFPVRKISARDSIEFIQSGAGSTKSRCRFSGARLRLLTIARRLPRAVDYHSLPCLKPNTIGQVDAIGNPAMAYA